MWSDNSFVNSGEAPSNYNQQDNYPRSPFGAPPAGQQYLARRPFQANMMQFEGGNTEGIMKTGFQPAIGLYNNSIKGGFSQNHFTNPQNTPLPPQSNPSPATTPVSRPITSISTRAAELKAQLLRSRERASSATPSVSMTKQLVKQQPGAADGSSSLHGSPRTSATMMETSDRELNIKELISHYADTKPINGTQLKDTSPPKLPTISQQRSSFPGASPKKSQVHLLGSPAKVTKPTNGRIITSEVLPKNLGSRHTSNGSMSDGEILEDEAANKAPPPNKSNDTKAAVKTINQGEQSTRKARDERPLKPTQGRLHEPSSPQRALSRNSKPKVARRIEDCHDENDARYGSRSYRPDYASEQMTRPNESETSHFQRRDVRDQNENHRRSDTQTKKREDVNRLGCEAGHPNLSEILPHDEDLREWLDITGYHNQPYREKILNRRRAIAALDAQRNALLAEMEAEDRGGVPIGGITVPPSTILLPPIPSKARDRAEFSSKLETPVPETQRDRVVSNKRPYSNSPDFRDESSAKIARTIDCGSKIQPEEDSDHGNPRSRDYDSSYRRTINDHRDAWDSSRYEGRGPGGGNSCERDLSPGMISYESKPLARTRSYDTGDDFHDRDRDSLDERDRLRGDRRPFVVRGAYKGRAFDPSHRGRGGRGGRGRGRLQPYGAES